MTSAAMARGELSFSKVRALTRVATPENESELLELARGSTTAQLERMVRAWKSGSRDTEAALERVRHESRSFSVFPGDDGMYVVRGRLDPEVGALLLRAVEAAGAALHRRDRSPGTPATADADLSRRDAARRRADAVGLLAEPAMAAGFGAAGFGAGGADAVTDEDAPEDAPGDAPDDAPDHAPVSGTRAERYQVFLHVDRSTLSEAKPRESREPGRSHLEDGTRVSPETARRLSCDAGVVRVEHDADSSILDVGRRTRTIPPALRRALEIRDRGCRFPDLSPLASGARGLRFTDAHHVRHWADGAETSLANCILLCRHYHRLIHEGGWQVVMPADPAAGRRPDLIPVFIDPRGGTHFEGRWKPTVLEGALLENPVQQLVAHNHRNGSHPDGWTACSRWDREQDIPRAVYLRAREAVG